MRPGSTRPPYDQSVGPTRSSTLQPTVSSPARPQSAHLDGSPPRRSSRPTSGRASVNKISEISTLLRSVRTKFAKILYRIFSRSSTVKIECKRLGIEVESLQNENGETIYNFVERDMDTTNLMGSIENEIANHIESIVQNEIKGKIEKATSELRKQIQTLQKKIASLTNIQEENARLQADIAKQKQTIEENNLTITNLQAEITQLKAQVATQASNERQIQEKEQSIKELQQNNAKLRQQIADSTRREEENQSELTSLQQENTSLQFEIEEIRAQLQQISELQEENSKLKQQILSSEQAELSQKKEYEGLVAKLRKELEEAKASNVQFGAIQSSNEAIQAQLTAKEAELAKLRAQLSQQATTIQKLKTENLQLLEQNANSEKEREVLLVQLVKFRVRVAQAEARAGEAEQQAQQAQARADEAIKRAEESKKQELQQLQQSLEESRARAESAENRNTELQQQLDQLQAQLRQSLNDSVQNSELQAKIVEIQNELARAIADASEARAEVDNAIAEANQARAEAAKALEVLEELHALNSLLTDQIEEYKQQISTLEPKTQELELTIQRIQQAIASGNQNPQSQQLNADLIGLIREMIVVISESNQQSLQALREISASSTDLIAQTGQVVRDSIQPILDAQQAVIATTLREQRDQLELMLNQLTSQRETSAEERTAFMTRIQELSRSTQEQQLALLEKLERGYQDSLQVILQQQQLSQEQQRALLEAMRAQQVASAEERTAFMAQIQESSRNTERQQEAFLERMQAQHQASFAGIQRIYEDSINSIREELLRTRELSERIKNLTLQLAQTKSQAEIAEVRREEGIKVVNAEAQRRIAEERLASERSVNEARIAEARAQAEKESLIQRLNELLAERRESRTLPRDYLRPEGDVGRRRLPVRRRSSVARRATGSRRVPPPASAPLAPPPPASSAPPPASASASASPPKLSGLRRPPKLEPSKLPTGPRPEPEPKTSSQPYSERVPDLAPPTPRARVLNISRLNSLDKNEIVRDFLSEVAKGQKEVAKRYYDDTKNGSSIKAIINSFFFEQGIKLENTEKAYSLISNALEKDQALKKVFAKRHAIISDSSPQIERLVGLINPRGIGGRGVGGGRG